MLSIISVLSLVAAVTAQELAPTEQISFSYPRNGEGIALPFPDYLAQLTGLSEWPAPGATPPFTPNMNAAYNATAKKILPDIEAPPDTAGLHCPVRCTYE